MTKSRLGTTRPRETVPRPFRGTLQSRVSLCLCGSASRLNGRGSRSERRERRGAGARHDDSRRWPQQLLLCLRGVCAEVHQVAVQLGNPSLGPLVLVLHRLEVFLCRLLLALAVARLATISAIDKYKETATAADPHLAVDADG